MQTAVQTPPDLACPGCGASQRLEIGSAATICGHCGTRIERAGEAEEAFEEFDLGEHLERVLADAPTETNEGTRCPGCSAETVFGPDVAADACPFCATPLLPDAGRERLRPRAMILPDVERQEAALRFEEWIRSLWFAPSALQREALDTQPLQGVFLPYWSFDAKTRTVWRGERGDVTQRGKRRRMRWRPRNGALDDAFDDVLIPATRSLSDIRLRALEPWDLSRRIDYDPALLAGFRAEHYSIEPVDGFHAAQLRMEEAIERRIRQAIGGDQQRLHEMRTVYSQLSFQYWLLPVWTSVYRFGRKSHGFVVNARTGEVRGDRPWSWLKLGAAIGCVGACVAALALALFENG